MTHKFKISGMTCGGCRGSVENTLKKVEGVSSVSVNLQEKLATIEMDRHIPLQEFKAEFQKSGGRFGIDLVDSAHRQMQ